MLKDASGYEAIPRDFAYAHVSDEDVLALEARTKPLGFISREQWDACRRGLLDALQRSSINDVDVRLKGSSTTFFSDNPDKYFPTSEDDAATQARISGLSENGARTAWQASPFSGRASAKPPRKHFWDSRFNLGIDTEKSDYDFQLSSDTLAVHLSWRYPDGRDETGRDIRSDHGGHYRDGLVKREFLALDEWAKEWSLTTGRQVNLASFSGKGPQEEGTRFKPDDWIVV